MEIIIALSPLLSKSNLEVRSWASEAEGTQLCSKDGEQKLEALRLASLVSYLAFLSGPRIITTSLKNVEGRYKMIHCISVLKSVETPVRFLWHGPDGRKFRNCLIDKKAKITPFLRYIRCT